MLDHVTTAATRAVRPYNGRLLAVETDVDETTRQSGLIVPFDQATERDWVRAVVTAATDDGSHVALAVGVVVYFYRSQCWRLHDAWVVDPDYVLAYEDD